MSIELKPCPFCGGDAEFERKGDRMLSTIVTCTCCGATQECGEEWDHGRTWNARHTPEGYVMVPVGFHTHAMSAYYAIKAGDNGSAMAALEAMIAAAQEIEK